MATLRDMKKKLTEWRTRQFKTVRLRFAIVMREP
jgi:hypothetical protein